MVFHATFNNISVISWRSVLFVEQTGVPGENHRPITDKLYLIMLHLLTNVFSIYFYFIAFCYDQKRVISF